MPENRKSLYHEDSFYFKTFLIRNKVNRQNKFKPVIAFFVLRGKTIIQQMTHPKPERHWQLVPPFGIKKKFAPYTS